ncbi:hypothetical protein [Mesorhizobium sp. M0488]|uniref:hypothetical protein n=1 Tax=unclassified Mesorhizobium TaxID=325217 RepID=UPI00333CE922
MQRYEQHVAWAEYCRIMASLALKIPSHQTELDLPQAEDPHQRPGANNVRRPQALSKARADRDTIRQDLSGHLALQGCWPRSTPVFFTCIPNSEGRQRERERIWKPTCGAERKRP